MRLFYYFILYLWKNINIRLKRNREYSCICINDNDNSGIVLPIDQYSWDFLSFFLKKKTYFNFLFSFSKRCCIESITWWNWICFQWEKFFWIGIVWKTFGTRWICWSKRISITSSCCNAFQSFITNYFNVDNYHLNNYNNNKIMIFIKWWGGFFESTILKKHNNE